ncbi:sodium:proton antiporter [Truepera radiovictrix]|uniref:Multisubunit sodium/proton antiporter, MrpC subunit (2.A.63.1) n=1 Tax=Truepera radiovictrix (strain DSM 17093 / CIP 108686 / LMG 22925 / RQ-24) TaxID=649638 RepID=D7CQ80_TRURR|nr:cation:proton antiporter subunit C [Truepera radiovictrix]ADI14864.1 multisubunit sodium/proton antiporter, MrpC subunit (2.A.63.1) [Truepera radiovictrix DSM 17093]WMT56585.1 cation:proton antiporter subunit C [Truepera radiovictrix]
MTPLTLYLAASALLFAGGLYTLLSQPHLLRKVLALNVMGSAVFLFLVSEARRAPQGLPDPVAHALVLTGIVVAVSATAFALALVRRLHAQTGRTELPEDRD